MHVELSAIAALRAKYAEIRRLRLAREPSEQARPALAHLAARFPGALRELDALPLATIEQRLRDLEETERNPALRDCHPWMTAQAEYHALARGALATKRWLAARRAVEIHGPSDESFRTHAESGAGEAARSELLVWAEDLRAVARPPGGRLNRLVFAKLGERLGMPVEDAERLVIPKGRRRLA